MNRKQFIHKIGLFVLSLSEKWFQNTSIERAEKRGKFLTRLLWKLDKKHRNRTLANLKLAFPDLSESEILRLAKSNYEHFGCVVADFLRTPTRTEAELQETTFLKDPEQIFQNQKQRPTLLITGHFGNWERMTHWLPLQGIVLSGVARDANDNEITQKVSDIRKGHGMNILSRGNAAREILTRLKKGEWIGLMPDQNADDAMIPFFGHPAGTVMGPSVLHRKTKAPILPMCCLRIGPGRYEIRVFDLLIAEENESAEDFMARVNLQIEEMIRLAPEQYLWMHDRWKLARRKGLL